MTTILYLPTRYFPAISGAEFYLQRIAEILKSRYNCKIDIFTSNAIDFKSLRSHYGKNLNKENLYYSRVNNMEINRFQVTYNQNLEEKMKRTKELCELNNINISNDCIKKFIQNGPYLEEFIYKIENREISEEYDLIHSTFFPYFNLLIGLILGKKIGKPTICTPFFHFSNPRYLDNSLIEILHNYNLIISCTEKEKKYLVENCGLNKEKIKVIPMGVDYDEFNKVYDSKYHDFSFRRKFLEKDSKFHVVLYCGYKNFEKGAISILKAIPYIVKKIKRVYFVFIGPSTKAFNRVCSKIKKIENVKILNFTPENLKGYFDKIKISAFNETDIYLMPSRSDAFGISFLEAWAAGKPVIGANIGATPEVIRNNIDGLLVEFDNYYDIADKVIKLLKDQKLRKKMGNQGRTRVMMNYTWDIIAKKTYQLYTKIINAKIEK
ncbi:MAG: glycosyltransferase family 4 protein [Candidatus Lokiarchaeota archaeon]|nr:glycosyltransferase family 4 protein [Candidatus Lokiarchaeota archaeon]